MVALRYLRAKRKQTAISVISVISVLGVAAGVAALIIVLAVNNGFKYTLESSLLSATAHVNVLERNPEFGIADWQKLLPKLRSIPHVVAATPGLYGQVALKGPLHGGNAVLKGVPLGHGAPVPEMLKHLTAGSLRSFETGGGRSAIVLGSRLAEQIGVTAGNPVTLISYQGRLTPLGVSPESLSFSGRGHFRIGPLRSGFLLGLLFSAGGAACARSRTMSSIRLNSGLTMSSKRRK